VCVEVLKVGLLCRLHSSCYRDIIISSFVAKINRREVHPVRSNMAEEELFWFWYGDNGEFLPFDAPTMQLLEDARRRGQERIRVQIGNNSYLLFLNTLEQTNEHTGHTRPISNATAIWHWRDDDGWRRYGREDALQLAMANMSIRDRTTCLVHGSNTYFLDLERRVQQNIATGYEREIRSGVMQPTVATTISGRNHYSSDARPALNDADDISDSDEDDSSDEEDPPELLRQAPPSYVCPLSDRIMDNPATTLAGSTYERKYIKRYLRQRDDDPLTGEFLPKKSLRENRTLRDMIEWWKEDTKTRYRPSQLTNSISRSSSAGETGPSERIKLPHHNSPILQLCRTATDTALPAMKFTETLTRPKETMDACKIVCLGLSNIGDVAFRNPMTENRKPGVYRYEWNLQSTQNANVGLHCNVYDFVGQKIHHASQSVFFSPECLYIIVWDLGASNEKTFASDDSATSKRKAATSLERDIFDNVHFWVDAIQRVAPDAIILPVASLDGSFGGNNTARQNARVKPLSESETRRRCLALKRYFERDMAVDAYIFFGDDKNPVPMVGNPSASSDDLDKLKALILDLSRHEAICPGRGGTVPPKLNAIRDFISELLQGGTRVASVQQLMTPGTSQNELRSTLQWLSDTGELLFYEREAREVDSPLGEFAVLDPNWMVSAIARILRADIYDDSYHGPVTSIAKLQELWHPIVQPSSGATKPDECVDSTRLVDFLRAVFLQRRVVVELNVDVPVNKCDKPSSSTGMKTKLVFLPGILGPGEHGAFVGLYNNSIFSKTILAHTLQFQSMVSPVLLERVCASLLEQVYSRASPDNEQEMSVGQLFVKNVLCWRTLLYFRLALSTRTGDGDIQASIVDVYVHIVDASSDICVGATYLGGSKQSLIVSAKGEEGRGAEVIWSGGYDLISTAVKQAIETYSGSRFDRYFFCPSCLARQQNLRDTRAWSEKALRRALEGGETEVSCDSRHTEQIQLILGQTSFDSGGVLRSRTLAVAPDVRADELMPGVVMVGLFDEQRLSEKIRRVGSGFIVDAERRLIVTAAHTLMKLWGQENFGSDNDGIEGAKVVIGVVPGSRRQDGTYPPAVFRYFAKIVKKDMNLERGESHVDACVLQITSRFDNDVDGNGDFCSQEISTNLLLEPEARNAQNLTQLDMTIMSQVGESIRILGFDQPDNTKVNRSFGVTAGNVHKQFETKAVGGERYRYTPRKKTVLNCSTIVGHSGGPCVNQAGQVIGILSCADFTQRSRSYLVPTSEFLHLIPPKGAISNSTILGCKAAIGDNFQDRAPDDDGENAV